MGNSIQNYLNTEHKLYCEICGHYYSSFIREITQDTIEDKNGNTTIYLHTKCPICSSLDVEQDKGIF